MDVLKNLLILYAGILLINAVLSTVLWLRDRTSLHRGLVFVWASNMASVIAQGAAGEGRLRTTLGFTSVFGVTISLSFLLRGLTGISVPWRAHTLALFVALCGSITADALNAPFWVVALPVCLAVAAPLLGTSVRVLRTRNDQLTLIGRTLTYSCLLFCAHNIDFAFLRDRPQTATLGFTIAILIAFMVSVTGPAVVLERIAEERARMAELDRLKNEFFANVSHELRTPLTLILAPVDELLMNPALGVYRDVLQVVRRNAQRLLRLIEDLLDLGRLDAGGLRLKVGPYDPSALAQAVAEACRPAAAAKAVELTFDTTGPAANMHGDSHRMEIVITNLVGNALKFTPDKGRIEVHVRSDDRGTVIDVKDNGPGIAPADQQRVFERFYQVEGSARRKHGGAGIGLALARDLVELHEGKLTVESEVGKGSTFRVWLPAGTDHFRPEAVERRRVVADTDIKRRAGDRRGLEARAVAPSGAGSAAGASVVPRRGSDAVSSMLAPAPSTVGFSVALPAAASVDVLGVETTHEATQVAELERLLADWGRRPKILLAEDEEDLREFIRTVLARHFDVVVAVDGNEALALLGREQPDLVLSDVMMPGMSGVDLCRAIRENDATSSIPVILLTARTGAEATLEGYGAGADDYVQKPFHARVLLARVRAQLKIRALALKLLSQARLAVAGTLAAGVLHEVRNPLNALRSAASILRDHASADDTGKKMLEIVADAVDRIHRILGALEDQVRPADGSDTALVDWRTGIEATLRLMAHRMHDITVHQRFLSDRQVVGIAAELNQVFLNLLDNAIRTSPRNIWVTVDDAAERVRVSVGDDGPGVPADVVSRVFDPFFTTRPVGEGTGLGLYLSRKLVKKAGGDLGVRPRTGGGAEFIVEVPAAPL